MMPIYITNVGCSYESTIQFLFYEMSVNFNILSYRNFKNIIILTLEQRAQF